MAVLESEQFEPKPRAIRAIEVAIEGLLAFTVLAQLIIVFLNIVLRSFFHYSFVWANETAGVALTVMAFLGGAIAYYRHMHMTVAVFTSRLPPVAQQTLRAVNDWIIAGIGVLILVSSIPVVGFHIYERSPMLGVSTFWFVLALPVGMVLLIVFALVRLYYRERRSVLVAGAGFAVAVTAIVLSHPLWAGLRAADASLWVAILMFFGSVFLGLPVGFSLALGTISYIFVGGLNSFAGLPSMMLSGVDLFVLLALPFFILAGLVMEKGGISLRLVQFIDTLVGHFRGGLLHVTIISMYIVSGMSGSKAADVAAVGGVMCNILKREGYSPGEGVAVLATSAVMGETVPPSIAMLILASITSLSVGALFIAGIVPAAVVGVCLMAMAYVSTRRAGIKPKPRASWSMLRRASVRAILPLLMPVILFGGIILGIATPTEVSSFAVVYGLILAVFVYRELDLRSFLRMIVDSALVTGMLLFIVGAATAFAYVLTISNLPSRITNFVEAVHAGPVLFIIISLVVLIVMGTLLEGLPALLIFGPLLLPIGEKLGIAPLHFAVLLIIAMGVGLFAPPFGIGLYVACAVGGSTIEQAAKPMIPYLTVVFIGLLIVAFFPWLTLALPNAFHIGK